MPLQTPVAYRLMVQLARPLLPLAAAFSPRFRAGHAGRLGAGAHLATWAARHRDRHRPLVWLHAPSVGEGHQAAAVLRKLRHRAPDWQIVYTHYSPSAAGFADSVEADVSGFLPYDTGAAEDVLRALAPTALIFVKLDLWPNLAVAAARHGAAVGMVAATVRPDSGRLRAPVRRLLAPGYRAVTAAGAVSTDDADRLALLGVARDRIEVLGDPRHDSVLERWADIRLADVAPQQTPDSRRLVAGSTWPQDEEIVLDALARVRVTHPHATLLLAPHEPTSSHLTRVERLAAARHLAVTRLAHPAPRWDVLLVDRVGALAGLYGLGGAAYVGGGYRRAGLHSVLEPAAWSLPVAFGPRWKGNRDAETLHNAGAGFGLPMDRRGAVDALTARWIRWLEDPASRTAEGGRARAVVEAGAGGAGRNADLVARLVASGPQPGGPLRP